MKPPQTPHLDEMGWPSGRIDGARLWTRMQELSRIGETPDGGVDRPALSALELAARDKVSGWAKEIGAEPSTDPAGNLLMRLDGDDLSLPVVMTGSYLDSQPGGGRYSGAYGMLAALEALAAVSQSGRRSKRTLVAACWMNGEGSRFAPGYMGSEAFSGLTPLSDMLTVEDAEGQTVATGLADLLNRQPRPQAIALGIPTAAYVETHLEQGPLLEHKARQIGIVTGVQGVRRFHITVIGEAGHIGTTLRRHRKDALHATVKIMAALEQFFAAPDVGFTVSQLRVKPNAPSIVPRETTFTVDVRHHDNTLLTRLGNTIRLICESEKGLCGFAMREIVSTPAIMFAPSVPAAIERAADRIGLNHMPLLSLGGHDAQSMHHLCPSGIIFIPCKGGISHSAAEQIAPEHAEAGAKVLTDVLWDLSNS